MTDHLSTARVGSDALHGVAETMLITLWFRAHDARSAHPILGDPWAEDLVDRIDHDFSVARLGAGNAPVIVARGRRLDEWTAGFLAEHPDGQVLHLACGLDSRPFRVRRPPTSRWIDVDQPEVIDLRRRLYDLPDDLATVAASVTDPRWWDVVEPDRPTLVVAEGLLMYLPGDEVHALVDRVLARVGSGELVYDGVAGWVVPASRIADALTGSGARFSWGLEDLSRRHPALSVVDDVPAVDVVAEATAGGSTIEHLLYGALSWAPPVRWALRLERLRFG